MKKFILLLAFLLTVSSSFLSCKATDYAEYDLNSDGMLDADEYGDAYNEEWSTWDADGDGYLNDNEFYDTAYGWVDADNDDLISENEWNDGYNNLYDDYGTVGDFGEYDINDDGALDDNEWTEGWGDSEWFNDYDANNDELLDNNEWDTGVFSSWDEDGDGFWNDNEFGTYTGFYDTW